MSTHIPSQISSELNSAIKLLGDDWTLCIISSLAHQELRFCEIQRSVTNVNPVTLTDRLKKLEKEGIIQRKEETVDKLSVVYTLTKKGKAILPVIAAIESFAHQFVTST